MKTLFTKLIGTEAFFYRKASTLSIGGAFAQVLSFVFTIVLARFFSKSDYGSFAYYSSIATLISVIASGRYEQSILLQKTKPRVYISLILSFFLAASSLIILTVILSALFFIVDIPPLYYIFPVFIFSINAYSIVSNFFIRRDMNKFSIWLRILIVVLPNISAILCKMMNFANPLLLGYVLGHLAVTTMLFITSLDSYKPCYVKPSCIFLFAKNNLDFPKLNLPQSLLDVFKSFFLLHLINSFWGQSAVGTFGFCQRLLFAPAGLLGSTFGQMFFKELRDIKLVKNRAKQLFLNLVTRAFTASLIYVVSISFILVTNFFGILDNTWGDSWRFFLAMTPWAVLVITVTIVSHTPVVYRKQKQAFFLSSISIITSFLILITSGFYGVTFLSTIAFFSIFNMLYLVFILLWFWKVISFRDKCL